MDSLIIPNPAGWSSQELDSLDSNRNSNSLETTAKPTKQNKQSVPASDEEIIICSSSGADEAASQQTPKTNEQQANDSNHSLTRASSLKEQLNSLTRSGSCSDAELNDLLNDIKNKNSGQQIAKLLDQMNSESTSQEEISSSSKKKPVNLKLPLSSIASKDSIDSDSSEDSAQLDDLDESVSSYRDMCVGSSNSSGSSVSSSEETKDEEALEKGYYVAEDMNKQGWSRAKKSTTVDGEKVIQMEDTHYVEAPFGGDPDVGLFCVFDGHAGKKCSEQLVELFPRVFRKNWEALDSGKDSVDLKQLWLDTYREVDSELAKTPDNMFQGATCTTVLVWKSSDGTRRIQAAGVGDSSAFLLNGGKTKMLTVDHKVSAPSERERMEKEGVKLAPSQTRICGIAISRALGDHFLKDKNTGFSGVPEISKPQIISDPSKLVIASDGLWDIVPGRRVFSLISTIPIAKTAANKLLGIALSSPKSDDNITVIVAHL